jgi:hypothetical protein
MEDQICETCVENVAFYREHINSNKLPFCSIANQGFEEAIRNDPNGVGHGDECIRHDIHEVMITLYNQLLNIKDKQLRAKHIENLKNEYSDDVPVIEAIKFVGKKFDLEG